MQKTHGIAGVEPREPVGCSVTIGVKQGGKGFPVDKDRFHIVARRQTGDGTKPHLPAFAAFNTAAPEHRKVLYANLVHATSAQCFEWQLKNQVGTGGAHPDMRPFCTGDGVTASRWMGGDPDNYKTIQCPHNQCEYRSAPKGKPVPCKPWMRALFRLRWRKPGMPEMLAQFTSGSWNTTRNFVGLFDYIDRSARELGLDSYSLFGFPIVLQLTEQTKASAKSRFPVVEVSPEVDPISFFLQQRKDIRELSAPVPVAALTDDSEQRPSVVMDDADAITVPAA